MHTLWINVAFSPDPFKPAYQDDSIYGVSNLSNIPFGNLQFQRINSIGRQWIRQYCLASCKELLGYIRSKFSSVPIADSTLDLNGTELVTQGQEEKTNLRTELKEMLDSMTYGKMIEAEANEADNLQRILRNIPVPNGKAIIMG